MPKNFGKNEERTLEYLEKFNREKVLKLLVNKNSPVIDYKDTKLLSKYISEKGKIIPSRITNVSRGKQKELSLAIKRARFLSLMSYTNKFIN